MKEALETRGVEVSTGALSMLPKSTAEVSGGELTQALRMLDAL